MSFVISRRGTTFVVPTPRDADELDEVDERDGVGETPPNGGGRGEVRVSNSDIYVS